MEPVHSEFVPDPGYSRAEMEALQHELADTAIFEDACDTDIFDSHALVAGVDQGFDDGDAISAVVVMRGDNVVERVHARVPTRIPYIPGLLSFREGEAILAAFAKLETEPDVALFDGSGRIHFREAGLATHVGVTLDLPAVGVAKSLLCGRPAEPLDEPLPAGSSVPILADGNVTAPDGTVIGYAVQSRQYDSGNQYINPLYVSPGHRVSAETAADLVEGCCDGY
ncbi:MAG: endonuclease V, partial [Halovenus sp.]